MFCEMKDSKTPFIDALREYLSEDIAPFDVPGHHMGNIENAATELLGKSAYRCDVNAPIGLDNLAKPTGVLLQSERQMAKTCHADEAFFLINGTSSGIIAMVMTTVKAGEKIILPRNCHKSVINALILSGAVPVYVMPEIDNDLEIANQPSLEDWKKAIRKNPSAKAIFVINPTYFGAVGPLKDIVEEAHAHHMAVLVDEAHGAHYYFGDKIHPLSAMDAGADFSAASFHKTGGSLTQSSVLLMHTGMFRREDAQKSLNVINTTSPSPLLMASLEGAADFMASSAGTKAMMETYRLAAYARKEIRKIPGFIDEGKDHFLAHGAYDYDNSKLVIGLDHLDCDGYALYHLLKEQYHVQMELAEKYALLGIFAIGTKQEHVDRLLNALRDISLHHFHPEIEYQDRHYDNSFPFLMLRPRTAFAAPGVVKPLSKCVGQVSKESVMMYPPGIPMIAPGEVWTKEIVDRLEHEKPGDIRLLSSYPEGYEVIDLDHWSHFRAYEKRYNDYLDHRITFPAADGYSLPFEGGRHQATFMLLPYRKDTWRENAVPALEAYRNVAMAIAKHEAVFLGVYPTLRPRVEEAFGNLANIHLVNIRYNDAWARDTMPLFVTNGKHVRAVDFRFNAWGGDYDGLYANYQDDDKLASRVARRLKLACYHVPNFVLEGGSIAVDGEGTLIVTEACLLSKGRNPKFSKTQIEDVLRDYLGVRKIIWIPHGIYNDETDEHIDNMVSFVRPGEICLAWSNNRYDPQYRYSRQAEAVLSRETDANGRSFKIHKILVPNPPLFATKEETATLRNCRDTLDKRLPGTRLAASYVNYYQGEDFVILPAFGVPEDKLAYEAMQEIYPEKEIHQIPTREILLGGGNIHCITMSLPVEKEEKL